MPLIRLFLLLVLLGGLSLLLAQNWSPILPLVFLGMTTQALPLAVWILISVVAGAFTSLLIAGLFKLSNYFVRASSPQSRRTPVAAQRSEAPRTTARPSQPDTNSASSKPDDDWDANTTTDDWDFEEADAMPRSASQRPEGSFGDSVQEDTVKGSKNYAASHESNTVSQPGAYSYSYREPSNSGVGKTESVYDANYRVIKPPHQQINTDQDGDDWGFEDDDLEDEGESNSPNIRR